jgi:hypothetical protein
MYKNLESSTSQIGIPPGNLYTMAKYDTWEYFLAGIKNINAI